jgi:NAD(P)H-dependent FMN reductase
VSNDANGAPIRILGIGGEMSDQSRSRIALQSALRLAEDAGATTILADVLDLDLPLFNPEWTPENHPTSIDLLLEEVPKADAYIICSPDYYFTVSGAVKNALDMFSLLAEQGYLGGKPVGLMATGVAVGNVITALNHAAHSLNGLVVPTPGGVPDIVIDLATESITNEPARQRLVKMVGEVIDLAQRLRATEVLAVAQV